MMLRNNALAAQPISLASARSAAHATAYDQASRLQVETASQIDALVESLMPEGLSANKQAVIEQLIAVWHAKAERDIA